MKAKDCSMHQKAAKGRRDINKAASPNGWQRWMERMATRVSPTRIDHPFHVVNETTPTVDFEAPRGKQKIAVRQYDVEVPYLDMGRRPRAGKAGLFIPQDATEPMPLIVSMHYGISLDGAAEYLARGWAVMTPPRWSGRTLASPTPQSHAQLNVRHSSGRVS